MKLGVNDNPSVRTYAYSAYLSAILENRVLFSGEIINASGKKWKYKSYGTTFEWDKDFLSIVGGETTDGKDNNESFAFCEYDAENGLTCHINQIVNLRKDGVVNFFVGNIDDDRDIHSAIGDCLRVVYTSFGLLIVYKDQQEWIDEDYLQRYVGLWNKSVWIRVMVKGKEAVVALSFDGSEFFDVYTCEQDFCPENLCMGINSNSLGIGENYYNWLYSNYTEIIYNRNEKSQIYLNYYNEPYTGIVSEQSAPGMFVDTSKDLLDELVFLFDGLNEYLSFYLRRNYYIIVSLDEFYIPGHSKYNDEHFFHPLLVYGYNKETEEYLALDYDMKLINTRIPREVAEMDCIFQKDYPIMRYRYLSAVEIGEYHFNLASLKNGARAFLNSCPNEELYPFRGQRVEGIYGIDALKEFVTNEEGTDLFFDDRRLTFFLYEHSTIMKKRFDYMLENGYGNPNQLEKLKKLAAELVGISEAMKNAIIWIKMGKKAKKEEDRLEKRKIEVIELLNQYILKETDLMQGILEL